MGIAFGSVGTVFARRNPDGAVTDFKSFTGADEAGLPFTTPALTKIQYPTAWENWEAVTGLSGPESTKETIDITSFDTLGGFKEHIGSFREGGELTVDMNYNKGAYEAAIADFNADGEAAENWYSITIKDDKYIGNEIKAGFGNESCWMFRGFINSLPLNIQVADKVMTSIKIKITGKPHWTGNGRGGGALAGNMVEMLDPDFTIEEGASGKIKVNGKTTNIAVGDFGIGNYNLLRARIRKTGQAQSKKSGSFLLMTTPTISATGGVTKPDGVSNGKYDIQFAIAAGSGAGDIMGNWTKLVTITWA